MGDKRAAILMGKWDESFCFGIFKKCKGNERWIDLMGSLQTKKLFRIIRNEMGFRVISMTNRYKIMNPTDGRYLGDI